MSEICLPCQSFFSKTDSIDHRSHKPRKKRYCILLHLLSGRKSTCKMKLALVEFTEYSKIIYAVCVVLHFLCVVVRLAVVYVSYSSESARLLFLLSYLPVFCTGTGFAALQLYAINREIKEDLIWHTSWFLRVSWMNFLFQSVHLFGFFAVAWILVYSEHVTSAVIVDYIDCVSTFVLFSSFIFILFRPLFTKEHFKPDHSLVKKSLTETANERSSVNVNGILQNEREDPKDVSESCCCSKKCDLIFAIVCVVLSVTGWITVLAARSMRQLQKV